MTRLFTNNRACGYIAIVLLTITVLGIAAYWGSIFLPDINRDYGIFAIVVPCLTLLSFIILLLWSRPYAEAIFLFVLGVLWLAMGAWTVDIVGNVQCSELGSQRTNTKTGSISTRSYCYEMKVVEAFSWMIFVLFAIFFWILVTLTNRAKVLGRPFAWYEPMYELPWFGQFPGMQDGVQGQYGPFAYPAGSPMMYPMQPGMQPGMPYPQPQMVNGGYVVAQQPGHSVVIQPGSNGQAPTITQVPGMVSSV